MPRPKETYSYVDEWRSLWKPDLDALGGYSGATSDPTRIHPNVVEWAKLNCSDKPHFIKVINNNAANGGPGHMYGSRMSRRLVSDLYHSEESELVGWNLMPWAGYWAFHQTVPNPFVKAHFRELKRVVTLENEDGRNWKVSFGEISSHPSWQQGWRRLAMDHDLQAGEVIVFILVGNSHFRFARFDEDGNILSIPQSPASIADKSDPRKLTPASKDDHSNDSVSDCDTRSFSSGFDIGTPEFPETFSKKRRLGKLEEIKSNNIEKRRGNTELILIHDSNETASTSTAGNPSSVTIETRRGT